MKILFVIYELSYADHIALAYLSAMAKQLHHSTFFCSLDSHDFFSMVDAIKPDVIAYSVNIQGFIPLVKAHKEACKRHSFISIMGGPHPTFSPETFSESGVDAYCIGEGEYAFQEFLRNVEKGESFDFVENLITKNRINPIRSLISDLDTLPPADRDLVLANSFLKDTQKKTFYATRGCPFSCAYCCNNYYQDLYKGKGPLVRRFSVERIIQEIERVRSEYQMSFIKFGDDLFAMKADPWLEEFTKKYAQRIGIPFNCYLRFDCITDAMLKLLKEAGCFSVHLSVDSTSQHIREHVLNRSMKAIPISDMLKKIKRYGINTWVNYMLAVPESSLQDDLDSIEMSREGKVTYTNYSTTVPIKGTRLFNHCVERGYINSTLHKSDMTGCIQKSTLSCFSEKEKDIRYNIYLLGSIITKLPFPLYQCALFVIKIIPPNAFFKKLHDRFYTFYIMNKIFKLKKA
ncbi:MAG: radical SAM protein [Candidatus Omnitrophota bacterium]